MILSMSLSGEMDILLVPADVCIFRILCGFLDRELISHHVAFDPLFFFHHAQIDRLLALWDALHDQWVPGEEAHERKSLLSIRLSAIMRLIMSAFF